MATLYTNYDRNIRLTWAYMTGFLVFTIGVGYGFAGAFDNGGILVFATIFAVAMSFGSYWWSDSIVLAMSDATLVDFETNKELYRIVENLAITAGLPAPKIYVVNDPAMNAFATGRDPEHGVICFTTGLLAALDKNEIQGVAAHELSHIGNRDTLLATVIVVMVGFIAILAHWFRNMTLFGGRRGNDGENSQANMIFFLIGLVLSILAPIAATLIQLAISRKREFLADASGVLLTRYPEGLASALEKISGNPAVASVNSATAHLFIESPVTGKKLFSWFMTHPPVEERIAALRGMETSK